MASLSTLITIPSSTTPNPRKTSPKPQHSTILSSIHKPQTLSLTHFPKNPITKTTPPPHKMLVPVTRAQATPATTPSAVVGLGLRLVESSFLVSPPTWQSAVVSNLVIFFLGYPLLVLGLSLPGIGAAFLLGTLTWRTFGHTGFLLVATYFLIGTGATKVKMAQKEAQGVAEKRKGRRGPGSVIGSSAAGCVCAFLSIIGVGGKAFSHLWVLGFVASFCTKLSDTVSSEIGKAYGKTT
ncbi:hypothetical protein RHGRI_018267 [Rhododendron griersonianum]|nr:hypothetical protein RHGRI_018267 [Rhododendron griersonianum]